MGLTKAVLSGNGPSIFILLAAPILIPAVVVIDNYSSMRDEYREEKALRAAEGNPPSYPIGESFLDRIQNFCGLFPVTFRRANIIPNSTHQQPRLPFELTDMIIDMLAEDGQSLKTCSLVCRQWVHHSRSHLFHSIHPFRHSAYSFVPLLASQNATFTSHLRRVELSDSTCWTTVSALLNTLSQTNASLTSLRLNLWRGLELAIPPTSSLLRSVMCLELRLDGKAFDAELINFVCFLSHFPSLESLSIIYAMHRGFCTPIPPRTLSQILPPSLTKLTICTDNPLRVGSWPLYHFRCRMTEVLSWVLLDQCPNLKELDIALGASLFVKEELEVVAEYLRGEDAHALRVLTLDISPQNPSYKVVESVLLDRQGHLHLANLF